MESNLLSNFRDKIKNIKDYLLPQTKSEIASEIAGALGGLSLMMSPVMANANMMREYEDSSAYVSSEYSSRVEDVMLFLDSSDSTKSTAKSTGAKDTSKNVGKKNRKKQNTKGTFIETNVADAGNYHETLYQENNPQKKKTLDSLIKNLPPEFLHTMDRFTPIKFERIKNAISNDVYLVFMQNLKDPENYKSTRYNELVNLLQLDFTKKEDLEKIIDFVQLNVMMQYEVQLDKDKISVVPRYDPVVEKTDAGDVVYRDLKTNKIPSHVIGKKIVSEHKPTNPDLQLGHIMIGKNDVVYVPLSMLRDLNIKDGLYEKAQTIENIAVASFSGTEGGTSSYGKPKGNHNVDNHNTDSSQIKPQGKYFSNLDSTRAQNGKSGKSGKSDSLSTISGLEVTDSTNLPLAQIHQDSATGSSLYAGFVATYDQNIDKLVPGILFGIQKGKLDASIEFSYVPFTNGSDTLWQGPFGQTTEHVFRKSYQPSAGVNLTYGGKFKVGAGGEFVWEKSVDGSTVDELLFDRNGNIQRLKEGVPGPESQHTNNYLRAGPRAKFDSGNVGIHAGIDFSNGSKPVYRVGTSLKFK